MDKYAYILQTKDRYKRIYYMTRLIKPWFKTHFYKTKNIRKFKDINSIEKLFQLYILNQICTPVTEEEFYFFDLYYSVPYHDTDQYDDNGEKITVYVKDLMEGYCLDAIEKGNNAAYLYLIKFYNRHGKIELAEKYALIINELGNHDILLELARAYDPSNYSFDEYRIKYEYEEKENLQAKFAVENTDKFRDKAIHYYVMSIDYGNVDAMKRIIKIIHENRYYLKQNGGVESILDHFGALIAKGNIDAMYYLGCHYSNNLGYYDTDGTNKKNMEKYLLMAHEGGHKTASDKLFSYYLHKDKQWKPTITSNDILSCYIRLKDYHNFARFFYIMMVGNGEINNNKPLYYKQDHIPARPKEQRNKISATFNTCHIDDHAMQYLLEYGHLLPEDAPPLVKMFYNSLKVNQDLKKEIEDLKLAVYYHPSGDAAQQAKASFSSLSSLH